MNKVKEKLRNGGTVMVFNPNFPSPALVEHAGELGFDVAFIDCEHGSAGFERAEELARAARAAGMTSLLRPWSNERALVTRFLDCGVGGIQFPGIATAAAARDAVDIVRTARGRHFEDTLVAAMIESSVGITNLHEIVAVEGLDVVVVGLADLARDLGHPDDNQHPDVRQAVHQIISIANAAGNNRAGAVVGFNLHRWEDGRALSEQGVRWFTIHAKTMLARGARELGALLGPAWPRN
jgi:2-keto-3-deoxy-L-rhamnonate aldolase RhmA